MGSHAFLLLGLFQLNSQGFSGTPQASVTRPSPGCATTPQEMINVDADPFMLGCPRGSVDDFFVDFEGHIIVLQ